MLYFWLNKQLDKYCKFKDIILISMSSTIASFRFLKIDLTVTRFLNSIWHMPILRAVTVFPIAALKV